MKNEMLALAVVAAACLAALPAAAVEYTDWFAGTASTTTNAEWDEDWPEGVKVSEGKIVFSADTSALKLTPTNAVPAINKTNVVVTSTAAFTTFDYEELANLHMSGSQISFVVAQDSGVTNYYGYAGNSWIKLTGKAPLDPETDTAFTVTIDYSARTVSFAVDGTTLSAAGVDGGPTAFALAAGCTHVADVTYSGIGTVTSIDADYQKAIASYANLGYITYADAIKAGGKVDTITDPDYPSDQQTAANGLPKWQCKALGLDVTDAKATIKPVPVAKDTDTENVTLETTLTPTETELEVKLQVKKGEALVGYPCPADAIKLPLATGVYTVEPVFTVKAPTQD